MYAGDHFAPSTTLIHWPAHRTVTNGMPTLHQLPTIMQVNSTALPVPTQVPFIPKQPNTRQLATDHITWRRMTKRQVLIFGTKETQGGQSQACILLIKIKTSTIRSHFFASTHSCSAMHRKIATTSRSDEVCRFAWHVPELLVKPHFSYAQVDSSNRRHRS